ncbi:MAG: hypothetical protein AAF757_02845 [Cyanobacteria bacterium P01_D01_bin.116]
MLRKTLILGVCFVTLIGCSTQTPQSELPTQQQSESSLEIRDNQRQIAISNIKQLEQESAVLSQKMIGRQQKISNLELKKNDLETDIQTHNRKVQSFIQKNKDAVVCMGAADASLDESNQYSEDVKNVAGAVTVACGIGVLANEEFRNKVIFVADQLVQADNHMNNLKTNFQSLESQLDTENNLLAQEQSEARELATSIQKQQSQLETESQVDI